MPRYFQEDNLFFHLPACSGTREELLGLDWSGPSPSFASCQICSGYVPSSPGASYWLSHAITETQYNHQPADSTRWTIRFWSNIPNFDEITIVEGAFGLGWSSTEPISEFTDRLSDGLWLEWTGTILVVKLRVNNVLYRLGSVSVPVGKHQYECRIFFDSGIPSAEFYLKIDNEIWSSMSVEIPSFPVINLAEEVQIFGMTYAGREQAQGITVEDIGFWLDAEDPSELDASKIYELGFFAHRYADHYYDTEWGDVSAFVHGYETYRSSIDPTPRLLDGLWGFGRNDQYQLGLNYITPTAIKNFTKLLIDNCDQVRFNNTSSYYLKLGQVFAAGYNAVGECGQLNLTPSIKTPTIMKHILSGGGNTTAYSGIISIHTGTTEDVVALRGSNPTPSTIGGPSGISVCGYNSYGEFGLGHTNPVSGLKDVGITNVAKVSVGTSNVFVVKSDGTVWGAGANNAGCLAVGDWTNRTVFTRCSGLVASGVVDVCSSAGSTIFLKTDGLLYSAGYNQYGQLGIGTQDASRHTVAVQVSGISNVVKIVGGVYRFLAQTQDGTVYAWGRNANGECGVGNRTTYITTPTAISGMTGRTITNFIAPNLGTIYLDSNHKIWAVGYNDNFALGLPVDGYVYLTPTAIASGIGINALYGSNNDVAAVGGTHNPNDTTVELYSNGYIQLKTRTLGGS